MSTPNAFKRHLITAALPYANGPVHIGHIAGCYLPADIYVRFLKMQGNDVCFVCGSDEHGVPITIKAKNEGVTPQEIVDRYHSLMQEAFFGLGISFDTYHRTSDPLHHKTASDFFLHLYEKGVFEEKETEQYFDPVEKQFLADRYIVGTCPKCGHDHAYGDQCEACGASLSPTELIDPKSTLSGEVPVLKKTVNWFLPLDAFQEKLTDFIGSKKSYWKSNVYGQCMSWLQQGLHARAMTRDLDWGVKVPVGNADGKVLYVWFDAPIGYISATKAFHGEDWEKYWKSPDTRLVHFIGKDNIVFHCLIFPAMLMAHGGYNLPENVPANEFLNLEGKKISTSRNWAVWVHEYLNEFPGREDELRYVLTSIAPESGDSEFTWSDFQARVNNELVAILGNFVNRVMVLYKKFFDSTIDADVSSFSRNIHNQVVEGAFQNVSHNLHQYKFKNGLIAAMEVARHGNRFLTETEPWKLFKTDPLATRAILNDCLLLTGQLSFLLYPFMPHTSKRLLNLLNLPNSENTPAWESKVQFSKGHILSEPQHLFTKIDDAQMEIQREKLNSVVEVDHQPGELNFPAEKAEVSFEDFTKMDIRVGEILSAEKVKKADKLLHLTVDVGIKQISLVSGIAQYFAPEVLPGTKVCVLLNLAPRKIRGVMSQGMILMAENPDGSLRFVQSDAATGSIVG
ncbi:MAG: methionine--tRNA ligase [Cryomorphaceae bacterium]|nr:methionine--tRNA ligase [Cryomorphaceae bacterium]